MEKRIDIDDKKEKGGGVSCESVGQRLTGCVGNSLYMRRELERKVF